MSFAHHPPERFSRTKSARIARRRLARRLEELDHDRGVWERVQAAVPEDWAWLEEDLDLPEERVKISIRLDRSVVACFRAMGPGYTRAINRVLATYVQMQIGEVARKRLRPEVDEDLLPSLGENPTDRERRSRLHARLLAMKDENRDEFIMTTAPTRKELEAWDREHGYW